MSWGETLKDVMVLILMYTLGDMVWSDGSTVLVESLA